MALRDRLAAAGASLAAHSGTIGPGERAPRMLTGWGRTAPSRATVWQPETREALTAELAGAPAGGVVARGLGRAYGDAAQNAGGTVAHLGALARVHALDPAAGRITVDAGISLSTLLDVLVPLGWFPMVVPGTRYVTVGGAIASDIHGKYRHGSFCESVPRFTLATPGRGLIDVAPGTDAFAATAGGMGLTGVVTDATLELHPIGTARMRVTTERATDVDDCMARMLADDDQYRYSVAWIDCLARGGALGRSVLTRGDHATYDELPPARREAPLERRLGPTVSAPPWFPSGLLNPLTVSAFNELWFRKAPALERDAIHTIDSFFFPLDGVRGWNRIYGRRGFVQYQFVVPYGAETTVREALARLSQARSPSFLAVLKRFSHDGPGLIGFPTAGWTLALDLPAAQRGLADLLDGLDRQVVDAGGRVYLTKDSRLDPALVPAMYPRLDQWRAIRDDLDPTGTMTSDLGRRLHLVSPRRWP